MVFAKNNKGKKSYSR